MEQELEELKLVRRPEVVERIKIARSYGDPLRKLPEYEAAKDEQAFVEGQISSLETKIRYAEIVDSDAVAVDEVAIGKRNRYSSKLAKQMKKYTASLVQQGQMPLQERFLTKAQSVTL